MTRVDCRLRLPAVIIAACLTANARLEAAQVIDPANDFRTFDSSNPASFAGPDNPALDVLSISVVLDATQTNFTLTQTMAGPISSLVGPGGALLGSYSWGINHGYGNNSFAEINLPNVLFDAVLTLNANQTGSYRGSQAPPGSVTVSGNTLAAVLPVSFLAPPPQPANARGPLLPVTQWAFNLWPRSNFRPDGTMIPFGDAQIADFAPDATDVVTDVAPEPSSAVTLGLGVLGVAFWLRFRTSRAAPIVQDDARVG
jgi:hypothetical protein